MWTCEKCGTNNEDYSSVCAGCGQQYTWTTDTQPVVPNEEPSAARRKKTTWIPILISIVLLVAVGTVWMLNRGFKVSNAEETTEQTELQNEESERRQRRDQSSYSHNSGENAHDTQETVAPEPQQIFIESSDIQRITIDAGKTATINFASSEYSFLISANGYQASVRCGLWHFGGYATASRGILTSLVDDAGSVVVTADSDGEYFTVTNNSDVPVQLSILVMTGTITDMTVS